MVKNFSLIIFFIQNIYLFKFISYFLVIYYLMFYKF